MKRFCTSAIAVLSLLGLVLPGCSLPPEPELGSEGGPGVQDAGKADRQDASGSRPDSSVVPIEGGADRSVAPPSEAGDSSVVSTPDTGATDAAVVDPGPQCDGPCPQCLGVVPAPGQACGDCGHYVCNAD